MEMIEQISRIKDTQHWKEWESISNQIHALQTTVVEPSSNDKPTPRANSLFSTNPFATSTESIQLYTISSMQTTDLHEPTDSKKAHPTRFRCVLQGMDLRIRANMNGDSNTLLVKSESMVCNGTMKEGLEVLLLCFLNSRLSFQ